MKDVRNYRQRIILMKITEFAALRVATRTEEAGVVDPWAEVSSRNEALDRYSRRFKAQNNQGR